MQAIEDQTGLGDAAEQEYLLDEQVGYLLRLATQRHTLIFQSHSVAGLTPTQFSAMVRLAEHGPCSQNQLGRYAAMDIATIKGVVDRLRAKGLVQTEASTEDRRRSVISLTADGRRMIQELHRAGTEITRETMAPLTSAEQSTLIKLLDKLT